MVNVKGSRRLISNLRVEHHSLPHLKTSASAWLWSELVNVGSARFCDAVNDVQANFNEEESARVWER